jgi:hypothetical protein
MNCLNLALNVVGPEAERFAGARMSLVDHPPALLACRSPERANGHTDAASDPPRCRCPYELASISQPWTANERDPLVSLKTASRSPEVTRHGPQLQ